MKTSSEFAEEFWLDECPSSEAHSVEPDRLRGECPDCLEEMIPARDREVAEKVREACANVALDYDGKGLEHDQYTQLGDAGRTLSDIEGAIRALDLEEVLK